MSARGVQMVGVFSNMQEGQAEVAAFAKGRGLAFPIVRDGDAAMVKRFGATMTPQAFVVDPAGAVVYSGRVDDSADASAVHQQGLAGGLGFGTCRAARGAGPDGRLRVHHPPARRSSGVVRRSPTPMM